MANAGYRAYLRSDHWQNLRLKRLASKKGKCILCASEEHVQVHHIVYPKQLKEVPIQSLKVLCGECHMLAHKIMELYAEEPDLKVGTHNKKWKFVLAKMRLFRMNARALPL